MTDHEQLAALHKQRDRLRAEATKYRAELERGVALLSDALFAPNSPSKSDAFPTEEGWPSYAELIALWGMLVTVEREIGDLEREAMASLESQ